MDRMWSGPILQCLKWDADGLLYEHAGRPGLECLRVAEGESGALVDVILESRASKELQKARWRRASGDGAVRKNLVHIIAMGRPYGHVYRRCCVQGYRRNIFS